MTTLQVPSGVDPRYYRQTKLHLGTYVEPAEAALIDACMAFEGYESRSAYIREVLLRNLESLRERGLQV